MAKPAPRPLRADARLNADRIVAAAAEIFARDGADASLEEIARQAGVGSATLHRHFASRWDLLETVFADGISRLCDDADHRAVQEGADTAIFDWLRALCAYSTETRGLGAALLQSGQREPTAGMAECHDKLAAAGGALLRIAQDAGLVEPNVTINELLTLVSAIALATEASPSDADRILRLAIDGIRLSPHVVRPFGGTD